MDFRSTPAGHGLAWFQAALRMLDKNPRGLLGLSLFFVLIQMAPNLLVTNPTLSIALSVLSLLLGPALFAGVLYAIGEADAGRPVMSSQIFEGLRRPGVRAQLLLLGVLQVLALFLVVLAAQRIFGADNLAILMKVMEQKIAPDSAEAQRIAAPLLQTMMVAVVILFVLLSGMFFAVPRVLFDGRKALGAFSESIMACATNVLSLTVYGLVLVGVMMVVCVAVMIVAAICGLFGKVGSFLFLAVLIAVCAVWLVVSSAGNYLAWRDVFGHQDAGAGAPPITGIEA
ncbi:MAG TPA: BPSS1780 family membrane protein [Xanthomonadaceae bacterium]|nr:BPSS1780 family membrane protein [Xanthomonadaceae bacterium]